MCGICGFIGNDQIQLKDLQNEIINRGPDKQSTFSYENINLAVTRLSIRDIEKGDQPFIDREKSMVAALNGEIYNYGYLRKKLESKGHKFKTHCDTELLIPGFYYFNKEFFNMINGMFALIIIDLRAKKIFIARDRFGIKPLFYCKLKNSFIYSSSAKSIYKNNYFKKDISKKDLISVLQNRYTKYDHIFKNIFQIKPGHYLEVDNKITINEFSYLKQDKQFDIIKSREEFIIEISNFFEKKLINYEESDLPISLCLSSGIDSRILLEKLKKDSKVFTLKFSNSKYDESNIVENLCLDRSIDYQISNFNDEVYFSIFERAIKSLDSPICDSVIFPTFFLYNEVAKEFKVTLSGEGADEIFGGYYHFNIFNKLINIFKFNKVNLIPKLLYLMPYNFLNLFFSYQGRLGNYGKLRLIDFFKDELNFESFNNLISIFSENELKNYLNFDFKKNQIHRELNLNNLIEDNHSNWLRNYNLSKTDQLSMESGLEVRVPYLDNDFYSLSKILSLKKNQKHFYNKNILKYYYDSFISKNNFKKIPLQNYNQISEKMMLFIEKKISKDGPIFEFINKKKINHIFDSFKKNNEMLINKQINSIIILDEWLRQNY